MSTPRARDIVLALLCLLLLLPRVGGAHLHVCLDGSGPMVAVHLDGNESGAAGSGTAHDDQTFAMDSPVLGKASPPGLDGALLIGFALLVLPVPGGLSWPVRSALAAVPSPPFLRPPLRGPPA